jgi:hypothetical protein
VLEDRTDESHVGTLYLNVGARLMPRWIPSPHIGWGVP